jgi:3-deoxy-D-manno-octulosonic-acid transferase
MIEDAGIRANIISAGDTRFDRVISIACTSVLPQKIVDFCEGFKVIVAGSTWEEDEEELVHYARLHPQLKFIIAPHEIDEERLHDIKKLFSRSVYYSAPAEEHLHQQVMIIDNIGMLSSLYRAADIAYVGGGFNDSGIHNILEAAVYGKPILFGPVYEKFREACELVARGAAFPATTALEQEAVLDRLLNNEAELKLAGKTAGDYVYEKKGATDAVMKFIQEKRLLTN